MAGSKKGQYRRQRLAESEAVREVARRRSIGAPLIIVPSGVRYTGTRLINQGSFKKLGIDERYQRVRLTEMVNSIIHALRAGGSVPDPVTVAIRPDDTWWLVDGQQRFYAHLECDVPMLTAFYEVSDFEAERALFIALNRKIAVNANTMVKSWPGPTAAMVREANDKEGGPLYARVNLGNLAQRTFDASVVAKGVLVVATGIMPSGPIERILTRSDAGLKTNQSATERAEAFLKLIGAIWSDEKLRTGNRVRLLPMIALGLVAYRRWTGKSPTQPNGASLRRLKIANWDTVATVHARRFLPVFERFIESRWKEE